MIELSVIVSTYNREKYLSELLDSLADQSIDNSRYEVLIINNNSTDNTPLVARQFLDDNPALHAKYFKEETPGLSYARNRGINESRGEILVFIDDDAIAVKDYLKSIADYFTRHPETVAGGGKIIPRFESSEPSWMTAFLLPVVSAIDLGDRIKYFPGKKYPIGANMFFRKEVFERTGLFNTELGRKGEGLLGGEEKDIFMKLGPDAKIVYLPEALVYHFVPDKRIQKSYIVGMAYGIGVSESIRIRDLKKSRAMMYIRELIKWLASILLFLIYLFKFQYSKGKMLLIFRYNVSKGILTGNKK